MICGHYRVQSGSNLFVTALVLTIKTIFRDMRSLLIKSGTDFTFTDIPENEAVALKVIEVLCPEIYDELISSFSIFARFYGVCYIMICV